MKRVSACGATALHGRLSATATLLLLALAGCALSPGSASPAPEGTDAGYGPVDSLHTTGTAVTVDAEDPQTGRTRSFFEMLARVPGVQVVNLGGGSVNVRVRGASSFQSDTTPLFVLDGVLLPDLAGINPNDIESITVLKDASETAIYGARGANGVIVLTSKRR